MKKTNITTFFKCLLFNLPIIILILSCIHNDINDALTFINSNFFIANGLVNTILSTFGTNGTAYPLFTTFMVNMVIYTCEIELLDIIVNVIMLIPRQLNKLMNKWSEQ